MLDLDTGPGHWTWTLDLDTGPGTSTWEAQNRTCVTVGNSGWVKDIRVGGQGHQEGGSRILRSCLELYML